MGTLSYGAVAESVPVVREVKMDNLPNEGDMLCHAQSGGRPFDRPARWEHWALRCGTPLQISQRSIWIYRDKR